MASPQLENGFTSIAHELLEAIAYKLNNANWIKILVLLIRLTYGFHRKSTETTYKSIAQKTGFSNETAKTILWEMVDRHLIFIEVISANVFRVGINKDYESWRV